MNFIRRKLKLIQKLNLIKCNYCFTNLKINNKVKKLFYISSCKCHKLCITANEDEFIMPDTICFDLHSCDEISSEKNLSLIIKVGKKYTVTIFSFCNNVDFIFKKYTKKYTKKELLSTIENICKEYYKFEQNLIFQ
jgi:hypothetical protein